MERARSATMHRIWCFAGSRGARHGSISMIYPYLPKARVATKARELYEPDDAGAGMTDTPRFWQHHLKKLRLPTCQTCLPLLEKKDHVQAAALRT